MQTIKLEIINNPVDVIEIAANFADQGFNVDVKATGATATITAERYWEGEIREDDAPSVH